MSTDAYVLNGYRLTNLMMTGQTSQVWEAIQEGSGRRYALKLLLPERAMESEHRRYLDTEAKVGRMLQHPKIIKIFDYFRDKNNPHFVMEFFPGNNLKQRLVRKHDSITPHASIIIEQAAEALAYMHDKKWLHKDIKPDNIMVNGAGEVRLIDFALAEPIRSGLGRLFGKKGTIKGTRSYMSPEQIRRKHLDERADVYSFGCTIYEVFCGRPPFRADTPTALLEKHLYEVPKTARSLNPALTPELDELIMNLLSKDPKKRLENMHEFLAKFRGMKLFSGEPKLAKPV